MAAGRTMNTERRSHPRLSGPSCPHCDSTRLSAHHLRDTGDLNPADAVRLGYCPTLVAKRNGLRSPATPAELDTVTA